MFGTGFCCCDDVSEVPASSQTPIDCRGCTLPRSQVTYRKKITSGVGCGGADFTITLDFLDVVESTGSTTVRYHKPGIHYADALRKGDGSDPCFVFLCCDLYIENPVLSLVCSPAIFGTTITGSFGYFEVWYTKLESGCKVCGTTADTKNTSITGVVDSFGFNGSSCSPLMVYYKLGATEIWLSE